MVDDKKHSDRSTRHLIRRWQWVGQGRIQVGQGQTQALGIWGTHPHEPQKSPKAPMGQTGHAPSKVCPCPLKQQNYEENNFTAIIHPPQMKIMGLPSVWPKPKPNPKWHFIYSILTHPVVRTKQVNSSSRINLFLF